MGSINAVLVRKKRPNENLQFNISCFTVYLMKKAISRDNDDAIPLWERYLSDQLSRMVLAFCEGFIWLTSQKSSFYLFLCMICLEPLMCYLSVWGYSWCWPLWSLAGCGSDTTASPGPSHWKDWPITVVAWDEVGDFLKILLSEMRGMH